MEVRHCDYLPDIMKKAIRKHNEIYGDNVTKVETDFYGTISIWINSFNDKLGGMNYAYTNNWRRLHI